MNKKPASFFEPGGLSETAGLVFADCGKIGTLRVVYTAFSVMLAS
jgi:hypothetical protein